MHSLGRVVNIGLKHSTLLDRTMATAEATKKARKLDAHDLGRVDKTWVNFVRRVSKLAFPG